MHSFSICALAALLGAVTALPAVKRDIVWVTETNIDVITIPVTKTVWVDGPANTDEAFHSWTWTHSDTTTAAATSSTSVSSASSSTSVSSASSTSPSSVYVAPTTSSVYVAPTTSSTSIYVAPTTSSTSVYVAPTTSSSSVYVAPTTSSTSIYVAPTTSTSSAPAATSSSSSASGGGSGDMTYYTPGLGSCGITSGPDDAIVALAVGMMDANWSGNPNDNPLCNQAISITWNGITKSAKIVDTCPGCTGGSLDLTPGLFSEFADESLGRLTGMTWVYA